MVETITEILACYDPMGLISMGAPRNEYEPEAENITIFVGYYLFMLQHKPKEKRNKQLYEKINFTSTRYPMHTTHRGVQ